MHRKTLLLLATPLAIALPMTAALASPPRGGDFRADVEPVPHNHVADRGSDVDGDAKMRLKGRKLIIDLDASGLTPGEPHAMHIHGVLGQKNVCPGIDADENTGDVAFPDEGYVEGTPDGLISLSEGAPDYGPVLVSLTAKGNDTSAANGLNVPDFVAADEDGDLEYERKIRVSKGVAKNLSQLHIVIHGTDLDADGSSLDSLFQATLPVSCGEIEHKKRGHH